MVKELLAKANAAPLMNHSARLKILRHLRVMAVISIVMLLLTVPFFEIARHIS